MKTRIVLLVLALLALVPGLTPVTAASAATPSTYAAYSMFDKFAYGDYYATGTDQVGGQWAWAPQPNGTSRIMWGMPWPKDKPPTYQEEFEHVGDWVNLNGWYDNGTFYRINTTTEWQAAADCRTGRTFLPTGGPQHYTRWLVPAASYCLYAEYTVTEVSTKKVIHAVHQQVWGAPAACPVNKAPNTLRSPGVNGVEKPIVVTDCISQWESWADDRGRVAGDIQVTLERSALLARGVGMAYQINQTFPSSWRADERTAALYR